MPLANKKPIEFIKPPAANAAPPPFAQLKACSWRGIEFPLAGLRLSFSHDLAEHKYVGVDGANLEATGRNEMQIEATIPFFNGIVPGKNESWPAGKLYPVVFRAFLTAFADKKTGIFNHPELGEINCKPESFEINHDPQRRDGVEVVARFRETNVLGADTQIAAKDSPVTKLTEAARSLDANNADVRGLAAKYLPPQSKETLESFANKITGTIDKVTIAASLAANKPAQMAFRVRQVVDAADRARTPVTWPVRESATAMLVALRDVAQAMTKGDRKVLRYTVTASTTLATLTSVLPGATTTDLIRLNPTLLARPEIQAGAVVRYYAK